MTSRFTLISFSPVPASLRLPSSSWLTPEPRFGNYIGEAESDEEQHDQAPQAFKFDDAFDDDDEEQDEADINDPQLMEVDGKFPHATMN